MARSEIYNSGKKAVQGAPNVVYIVLDDVGFAQINCFGSNINTPNINRLAQEGLRYNNFHTTAICSATRASLLTGANHHAVGVSTVVDTMEGDSVNTRGCIDPEYATTAEVLKEYGYTNYAVGKWHLTPFSETGQAGPFHNWPLGKGFDRFYGFLEGMTDQYNPSLVKDNERIRPPYSAKEGYHLTEDLAEQAIRFVGTHHVVYPERPFFLYFATGAQHAPHQAPKEYIDRYKGKFDEGWDVIRERWFENQKKLGIIPANTELNKRNEAVPAWDSLSADEKKLYARFMEVFAGFLEHTDEQIGKVLDYLDKIGVTDNTIFVLLSDNGASSEGGLNGGINHENMPNLYISAENVKTGLEHIDEIGTSEFTYPHYPAGWANVGNTPFQWYKSWVHAGGVKDPLIVKYPKGITEPGGIRNQFVHVIDIAPTILDVIGVEKPSHVKGVPQKAYHGVSFANTFSDENAEAKHKVQYFEQLGNRGIYKDGWKAVTNHGTNGAHYEKDIWELYYVAEDYSESDNVADEYPEKLQELIQEWFVQAGKYDVVPLSNAVYPWLVKDFSEMTLDTTDKFYVEEQNFVYENIDYPVDIWTKSMFNQRNHRIKITFEYKKGYEGVLYSAGHRFGGYGIYVKDGQVKYSYDYRLEQWYVIASQNDLVEGENTVELLFKLNGYTAAYAELYLNGTLQGTVDILKFEFNYETRSTFKSASTTEINPEYEAPFEYPGEIKYAQLYAASAFVDKQEYLDKFFAID